jgi:hypothetical protein
VDPWFFEVEQLLERFGVAGDDRRELTDKARDWIGLGRDVLVDWERHTEEFIRLVRLARRDPVPAFEAERRVRDLIRLGIAALERAIDGRPNVDDRERVSEWATACSALSEIETYVAALVAPVTANCVGPETEGPEPKTGLALTPTADMPEGGGELANKPQLPASGTTASPVAQRQGGRPATQAAPVPVWLATWGEIFAALNEGAANGRWKNTPQTRRRLLDWNDRHGGPIIPPNGKGTHPRVNRDELLKWMVGLGDDLDHRRVAAEERSEAERLMVADRHPYGSTGIVVPDIGGSVKPSRRSRR